MAEGQTVTYHTLTSTSTNRTILPQLLTFSNSIFTEAHRSSSGPSHSSHSSTHLSKWQSNLSVPGSVIIYATLSSRQNQEQAEAEGKEVDDTPVAFLFALPRTHPELSSTPTLHIWLAGVDPKLRGMGVWKGLMERLIEVVRQRGGGGGEKEGREVLTICTYPRRFERMYALLGKNGWEVVGWREEGEKVLMRLGV